MIKKLNFIQLIIIGVGFSISVSSIGAELSIEDIKNIINNYKIKKEPDFSLKKVITINSKRTNVIKKIYKKDIDGESVVAKEEFYNANGDDMLYKKINIYKVNKYLYSFWITEKDELIKYKVRDEMPLKFQGNMPVIRYSYTLFDKNNKVIESEQWKINVFHKTKKALFSFTKKDADGKVISTHNGESNYEEYKLIGNSYRGH